jgi:uncharacterized membrane protein
MMNLTKVVSIITIISALAGGIYYIEDRYAQARDVQILEGRFDKKILEDDLRAFKRKLWDAQDEAKRENRECDECREIEADIEEIERKLDKL